MTAHRRLGLLRYAGIVLITQALVMDACRAASATTQVSAGKPFSSVWMPSLPVATSSHVVYAQDAVRDGAFELWSVNIDGGAPVRLSEEFAVGQSVKFQVTPDGLRAVYSTDQDTIGIPDLYSAPINGGASVKLSMPLAHIPGQVRDFIVSPTSQRVYFAADGNVNNKIELYSVPVTGGSQTKLNAAISTEHDIFRYEVSSLDRLVYRVGRSSVGQYELWSVPGDGRASQARRISKYPMVTGGSANEFTITKDGTRVLYTADAEDNGEFNLYAVAVTGGASIRLNDIAGGVDEFREESVAGVATVSYEQRIQTVTSWWSVPVTGGIPVPATEPVEPPVTSPDGRWYATHAASVLSLTRNGCTTAIDRPVVTTFLSRPAYSIDPSSKRVVFISGGEVWTSSIYGAVCLIWKDGFESGTTGGWR